MVATEKKDKYNLRSKKRDVEKQKKRKHNDDDNSSSEDDSDFIDDDEEEGYELDKKEYTKFLSKLFPSKYVNEKVNENKKKKKRVLEEDEEDDDENKIHMILTIDDKARSSYDEYDDSSYDEYDSDEEDDEEEDDEEEDDEEDDDEDEDEDEVSDEDEEEDDDEVSDEVSDEVKKSDKKSDIKSSRDKKSEEEIMKELSEYAKSMKKHNKNSKVIQDFIKNTKEKEKQIKKKENKKSRKDRLKNVKRFKKIVRENNSLNDYKFFEKMSVMNQEGILKELKNVCKVIKVEKPYRLKLLEASIPIPFKACALRKINTLRHMDPMAGDYYKLQHWVDAFMRIPFNKYATIPISPSDGPEKCQEFMENGIKSLNEAVYGMNDAKMQIIQMLAQWVTNPQAIGSAIAIKGPPGTGKTTLVKEGISKLLGREFAFIALGGATDSSFLEGHSYTYEGSTWGKIVDILIQKQSMNPVIYFDELDKISDTPKGEEIVGILTHLTDTSQNDKFHDKYFSEIDFDLSKCIFIFSYNDETKINPVLLDRMYRIQSTGYTAKEKVHIVKDYLLPKISKEVKINKEITIPDDIIGYIIESYTGQEKGVRNLKRCIEVIYRKLNLFDLMKPGTKLFDNNSSLAIEFPLTITRELVDKMVKKQEEDNNFHSFYL